MAFATEDDLEQWALGELQKLGFAYLPGSESPNRKELSGFSGL